MIGIVIIAHAGLAAEFRAAVEHIVGPQAQLCTISVEAGHDRAAKQAEICQAADEVDDGHGVVLVADIFGGSPSNLSLMACSQHNRGILYGANLPMLIKLAKSRHLTVSEAISAARDAGRRYISSLEIHEEDHTRDTMAGDKPRTAPQLLPQPGHSNLDEPVARRCNPLATTGKPGPHPQQAGDGRGKIAR